MSNFYCLANETLDEFLKADGTWTQDYNDAEHLTLQAAMEKSIEVYSETSTYCELFEIPLNHESYYEGVHSEIDALQQRLDGIGVDLITHIGSEDETTWSMRFNSLGMTLKLRLESPESFEVETDED